MSQLQRSSRSFRMYLDFAGELLTRGRGASTEVFVLSSRAVAEGLLRVLRIIVGVPIDAGLDVLAAVGVLSTIRRWGRRREECSPFIFARIQWLLVGMAALGVLFVCYVARTRVSSVWSVFAFVTSVCFAWLSIGLAFSRLIAIRSLQIAEKDWARGISYKEFTRRY